MWFTSFFQRSVAAANHTRGTRLGVERLENRDLMAGNLIENGSFEAVKINGSWDVVDQLPGWSVVSAAPDGAPTYAYAEVQRHGLNKWKAAAGNGQQWLELDGDENGPSSRWNEDAQDFRQAISGRAEHGLYSISQQIPTEIGKAYSLSYDIAARPGVAMHENRMAVAVADDLGNLHQVATQPSKSDKKQPLWQTQRITFVARAEITSVQFTGLGTDNTFGILLDDVSLIEQAPVAKATAAPPSLALAAVVLWDDLAAKKKLSVAE